MTLFDYIVSLVQGTLNALRVMLSEEEKAIRLGLYALLVFCVLNSPGVSSRIGRHFSAQNRRTVEILSLILINVGLSVIFYRIWRSGY